MSAVRRENTKTYIEKTIGNKFKMTSRVYSSNGIINRCTVSGTGAPYKTGEKVAELARKRDFKTDVGVLSTFDIGMAEGSSYDEVTLVFEELLSKNKYGFSVYTNMTGGTVSLPLRFNTTARSDSTKYEAKESYKYYWDHTIYSKQSSTNQTSVNEVDLFLWQGDGWQDSTQDYNSKTNNLDPTDLDAEAIKVVQNGTSSPSGWTPAPVVDNSNNYLYTNAPRLPETKAYYAPDVTITQTIYCEDDNIVKNIVEANGRLFAPRKTDRSKYDTYAISGDDTVIDDDNEHWLCIVTAVDTQSAISKVQVSYKYREFGWDTAVYQAYKRGWDAFTNTAISAAQPSLYG